MRSYPYRCRKHETGSPWTRGGARVLACVLGCLLVASSLSQPSAGQKFFDQIALIDVLEGHRAPSVDAVMPAYYEYFIFGHESNNSVLARHELYSILGDGDIEPGADRALLVELLNRRLLLNLGVGDTLVVPTRYGLDFRAYAPFPRHYPGASDFEKLFIIHKTVQAWAAYEHGALMRWGVVNTGKQLTPTPSGRFNFNWKQEYRVSTLSPPGEDWEMYWVFNIHHARGIHVHQYAFPTGGPTSHGCVRLIDADAKWVYEWAEHWETTAGFIGPWSAQGRIIDQGTTVLVLGDNPEDIPKPFHFREDYPALRTVDLPNNPYDVPPGTPQQERFDRLRHAQLAAQASSR